MLHRNQELTLPRRSKVDPRASCIRSSRPQLNVQILQYPAASKRRVSIQSAADAEQLHMYIQ